MQVPSGSEKRIAEHVSDHMYRIGTASERVELREQSRLGIEFAAIYGENKWRSDIT